MFEAKYERSSRGVLQYTLNLFFSFGSMDTESGKARKTKAGCVCYR